MNLPTVVETHKKIEDAYLKCGDVAQVVVVYGDEVSRKKDEERFPQEKAWRCAYPDGLAAPNVDAVSRKFARARRRRARVEATREEVQEVEGIMVELTKQDDPFEDEVIAEDVVAYEDWMVSVDQPLGLAAVPDDNPLAARHPWVFLPEKKGLSDHNKRDTKEEEEDDDDNVEKKKKKVFEKTLQERAFQEEDLSSLRGEEEKGFEESDDPATRAANEKRLGFVSRRNDVAREHKATQLKIRQKLSTNDKDPDLEELQATNRALLIELGQLDQQLLNCEIEQATLNKSAI